MQLVHDRYRAACTLVLHVPETVWHTSLLLLERVCDWMSHGIGRYRFVIEALIWFPRCPSPPLVVVSEFPAFACPIRCVSHGDGDSSHVGWASGCEEESLEDFCGVSQSVTWAPGRRGHVRQRRAVEGRPQSWV